MLERPDAQVEKAPPTMRIEPARWWRIVETRVGIVPLPAFLLLPALLAGFIASGRLASDISTVVALLSSAASAVPNSESACRRSNAFARLDRTIHDDRA